MLIPTDKSVGYWRSVPAGTKSPTLESPLPLLGWDFGGFAAKNYLERRVGGGKFGNDYGRSPCAEDSPFIPVAASAAAAHCMKNTPMLSVLPVQYSDSLVDFCRLMKQSTASSQDPAGTVELCEMHAEAVRICPQDVTSDTVDLGDFQKIIYPTCVSFCPSSVLCHQ